MGDCNHCEDEALFRFLTLLSRTVPFCYARDGSELDNLMQNFVAAFDLTRHRRQIWSLDHQAIRDMIQGVPWSAFDWGDIYLGMLAVDLSWRSSATWRG
jgi:hypothetical protein